MGDIGDCNVKLKTIIVRLTVNRIVEITRIGAIDGDEGQFAQILPVFLVPTGDPGRNVFCFLIVRGN